jgi:hypothetical protein
MINIHIVSLIIGLLFAIFVGLLFGAEMGLRECPPPLKAEFQGATFLDADHIERTWIYRDTVEYSKPKINFPL